MKKLTILDLFSATWQSFWAKMVAARAAMWKGPRGCQFIGYIAGIQPRYRDKDGKIVRGVVQTTVNEAVGQDYARRTRQPHLPVNAIPVWRRQWTDADRKPWVRAIPYAQA